MVELIKLNFYKEIPYAGFLYQTCQSVTYVIGYEKSDHFAHFPNFILYLWNHSSYELQIWHEYIFLHHPATLAANREPCPHPVWAGRAITLKNCLFMPHFGHLL